VNLDDDQLCCAALLTLAGPFTPMLFMGEEWAASSPFRFFTSHPEPELGRATAEGRFAEFEQMGWDAATVPDPQDPDTFRRSRLVWDERDSGRHAVVLDAYRRLGALRRTVPALTDPRFGNVRCTVDEDRRTFVLRRLDTTLAVNFGPDPAELSVGRGQVLLYGTPSGPVVDGSTLRLPAHAGALLGEG
jgi:maltooligosyltrehalose trehalohydrolase